MKGRINRYWCCTGYSNELCPYKGKCSGCPAHHRKWPTPEQFREEYGEEYPDDGAVYYFDYDFAVEREAWMVGTYFQSKKRREKNESLITVCAVTPWSKPSENWKPE